MLNASLPDTVPPAAPASAPAADGRAAAGARSAAEAAEAPGGAEPLLSVAGLEVAHGAIQAVWGVDLAVQRGQVAALLGPNGAGKTTVLRALAGLIPPLRGTVRFAGRDVTRAPAHERVARRLCLVPEGRQLWPRMTVEENLLLGAYSPALRAGARREIQRIYELFPRLGERRRQLAGTLSGGEQQMCAIGRGLMGRPLLLLLDEPSLGLAPLMVAQVFALVRRIAAGGVTILLAAQNARQALEVAAHAYVMETGRIHLAGPSGELRASDHVRAAYLGEE
jgi:branched-chain amino acid transport system ATP-binding protein